MTVFDMRILIFLQKGAAFSNGSPIKACPKLVEWVGDDTSRVQHFTPQRESLTTELTPQSEATPKS